MKILDTKGRLFGKVSLLDMAAGLVILLVAIAVFIVPGTSGSSVAQVGVRNQPIEVDLMVRGLTVSDPPELLETLQTVGTTRIIIRNQPSGQIEIKEVQSLPRSVAVPQPDGSVVSFPDPRPELNYTLDMLITLSGTAQVTDRGPVISGNNVKIGTQIELEGDLYNFNTSVVGVRLGESDS